MISEYNIKMQLKERLHSITIRKSNSILSASIVLGIAFALSAILGFLRSRFLVSAFFKCCPEDLDAYNAAFRLPDLIFKLLVSGALSASFIPVFSSYLHKDEKEAYCIANTVINLLLVLFTVASLVVLIFTHPLSLLIAKGFTPYQIDLMVNLTRILLIAQIFFLISNFFTGILQVNQIFLTPALSPILYNLFIIISIFTLVPFFGIYGATYGAVIGAFFHLAIQIPAVIHTGFRYSFFTNPKLKGVKEIINLMIPRTLSLGLGEIENTVTLFFATTLPVGSLSLLNLALQVMYLPSRIFGTTVGQASLPILSKNIAKNELDIFRKTVTKTVLQSLFIALPITALILVLRLPLVRLAFGSKQFPWEATKLTALTLAYLTPAIAFQAVIQILVRSFYALHNTKTPLKISFISLIIDIVISYLVINYTKMGITGLALSASVGNLIQCFGLLFAFIKKVDGFEWSLIYNRFARILGTTVLMGLFSWLVLRVFDSYILNTSRTFDVAVIFSLTAFSGALFFVLLASRTCPEEMNDYYCYLNKLKRFLSR